MPVQFRAPCSSSSWPRRECFCVRPRKLFCRIRRRLVAPNTTYLRCREQKLAIFRSDNSLANSGILDANCNMVLGERWVLKHHFQGHPKLDDFELVKEDLGELDDGEIIFQSEFISVDPYQRPYTMALKLPNTMLGSQVAKVIESKDPNYPVGKNIVAYAGWVKVGKINPRQLTEYTTSGLPGIMRAPEIGLSNSELLGACGMPGNTAYFGFLELCQPKAGDTVVVNGAAGAVGSLVGQIAKIKGCRVIAYAGTDDKVKWLKEELGFDHVFNYKKITTAESLKLAAPNGVDCFFDNVGGSESTVILNHMNKHGRIAVCGSISTYNDQVPEMAPVVQMALVRNELRMEGFLVHRWRDRWNEGIQQMAEWIRAGKIKTKETIIEGFEKTPEAFAGLFTGSNTGKMIVKI